MYDVTESLKSYTTFMDGYQKSAVLVEITDESSQARSNPRHGIVCTVDCPDDSRALERAKETWDRCAEKQPSNRKYLFGVER